MVADVKERQLNLGGLKERQQKSLQQYYRKIAKYRHCNIVRKTTIIYKNTQVVKVQLAEKRGYSTTNSRC